jgi:hypothetical protein
MKNILEVVKLIDTSWELHSNYEHIIQPALVSNAYKETAEYKSINNSFRAIARFKETKPTCDYHELLELEPDIRFVITHYPLLEQGALMYILPVVMNAYLYLETSKHDEFDATIPLYSLLILIKYKLYLIDKWDKRLTTVLDAVLEYVFDDKLKNDIFDEDLFSFRVLFEEEYSFIKSVFSDSNPKIAYQVKSFLSALIGQYKPQDGRGCLVSVLMCIAGIARCDTKKEADMKMIILKRQLIRDKEDLLMQYFPV